MAQIPGTLLDDLMQAPLDRPVALLMRHSARHPILDPSNPFLAMLTEEGVRMAEELGSIVSRRYACGRLLSSPVTRCQDTAAAIARGAGWEVEVRSDERLSHPFIEPAWEQFLRGEVNGVLPAQVLSTLDLVLTEAGSLPALDILVTHDTIVGAVAGSLLKVPVTGDDWPAFLEGVLLWCADEQIVVRWRAQEWRFDARYQPAGSMG